jgi:hypothetical protein
MGDRIPVDPGHGTIRPNKNHIERDQSVLHPEAHGLRLFEKE